MTVTHPAYRKHLALAFNDWEEHVLSGSSSTTGATSTLVNATSGVTANFYVGKWVYQRSGTGSQQIRKISNYVPSTGTFTVAPGWSTPSVSSAVEITRLFPAIEPVQGADKDYRTLINDALKLLLIEREADVTILDGDDRTTLDIEGVDRIERILTDERGRPLVMEPLPVSGRARYIASGWRGWKIVQNGGDLILESDVPAEETMTVRLKVIVPAFNWIHTGSAYAESTTGLTLEGYGAVPTLDEVKTVGMYLGYEALSARQMSDPIDPLLADKLATARAAAFALPRFDKTQAIEREQQQPRRAA